MVLRLFQSNIIYIKNHKESEIQANQALQSFKKYKNWNPILCEGVTAKTVRDEPEFKDYNIIENSRLFNFKKENHHRFLTKVSCAINHIRFWKRAVELNNPMCFIEHDAICTMDCTPETLSFREYLILNAEFVFRPPNKLGMEKFKNFIWPGFGINKVDSSYPLKYYKENIWNGSNMAPGTGAYAISPTGAKKMLKAIEKYGFDQSDFMINSYNIDMEYCIPSPIKFNRVNLSTSYGI